jgi:ribonucleoside-diphosphate reductase alpha chain
MNPTDLQVAAACAVIRRNGEVVPFDGEKIRVAIAKAFINDADGKPYHPGKTALSDAERDKVNAYTDQVVTTLVRRKPSGGSFHIEEIQDQVELVLMRAGEHKIASGYVRYRENQHQRRLQQPGVLPLSAQAMRIRVDATTLVSLNDLLVRERLAHLCLDLPDTDPDHICELAVRDLFDGADYGALEKALILAARSQIERDPAYSHLAARLLLLSL